MGRATDGKGKGEDRELPARFLLGLLPDDITEREIQTYFRRFGQIEEVVLKRSEETNNVIRGSVKFANPSKELKDKMLVGHHSLRGAAITVMTWKMQKLNRGDQGKGELAEKGKGKDRVIAKGKGNEGKGKFGAEYEQSWHEDNADPWQDWGAMFGAVEKMMSSFAWPGAADAAGTVWGHPAPSDWAGSGGQVWGPSAPRPPMAPSTRAAPSARAPSAIGSSAAPLRSAPPTRPSTRTASSGDACALSAYGPSLAPSQNAWRSNPYDGGKAGYAGGSASSSASRSLMPYGGMPSPACGKAGYANGHDARRIEDAKGCGNKGKGKPERELPARYLLTNLPVDITEEDVTNYFSIFAEIEEVVLKRDKETGTLIRGSVKFRGVTEEVKALMLNEKHELRDEPIVVQTWKMQKQSRGKGDKEKGEDDKEDKDSKGNSYLW